MQGVQASSGTYSAWRDTGEVLGDGGTGGGEDESGLHDGGCWFSEGRYGLEMGIGWIDHVGQRCQGFNGKIGKARGVQVEALAEEES